MRLGLCPLWQRSGTNFRVSLHELKAEYGKRKLTCLHGAPLSNFRPAQIFAFNFQPWPEFGNWFCPTSTWYLGRIRPTCRADAILQCPDAFTNSTNHVRDPLSFTQHKAIAVPVQVFTTWNPDWCSPHVCIQYNPRRYCLHGSGMPLAPLFSPHM